jgi:hypothetical protein
MILVIAHSGDAIARRLATAWDARLITPRDLSTCGWQHFPVGGGDDIVGLAEGAIPATSVRGVLTRIGAVGPSDLPHIAAEDRAYVAAEMTAFLLSFLRLLRCPVLNQPTASSLMGPGWTEPRWRAAAVATGLAVARGETAGETITVVGERYFGAAHLAGAAAALARHAGVELLSARLTSDGRFIDANPWADLTEEAAAAVHTRLT